MASAMVICSCHFRVSNSLGTTVFLIEFHPRRFYYIRFNTHTITIVEAGASVLDVAL